MHLPIAPFKGTVTVSGSQTAVVKSRINISHRYIDDVNGGLEAIIKALSARNGRGRKWRQLFWAVYSPIF